MPFFRYIASDAAGKVLEGTLQASSGQEATHALEKQGLRVTHLSGSGSSSGSVVRPPASTRPSAAVMAAPAAVRVGPAPAAAKPSVAKPDVVMTRRGKDKNLLFIFAQLASYFRAGMNPRQAFEDVANRSPLLYHDSLMECSKRTGEGSRIADVLARYPRLYPRHVVGMVRAGETGGFLPEAFQKVSDWALPSHRLKRIMSWAYWLFMSNLFCYPIAQALTQGSVQSWDVQEASGGSASPLPVLGHQFMVNMKQAMPITLLAVAVYLCVHNWWKSDRMEYTRHRLLLKVPILGGRARAEAINLFSYALGLVSRAGVPPHTAFEISAEAMPNLELAERMRQSASLGNSQSKITDLLLKAHVVPIEYTNIIQTGEVTGDVPGAAMQVAQSSKVDFDATDANGGRLRWAILLVVAVVGFILMAFLLKGFYSGLITHVVGE